MDAIPLLSRTSRLWQDRSDLFRPFRKTARNTIVGENIRPLFDPDRAHEHTADAEKLSELNDALRTLAELFPAVAPEVFRDMLLNISEESRVAVVTEQVLRSNLIAPAQRKLQQRPASSASHKARAWPLKAEEMFRGDEYHNAVRLLFYQEFRALSHSTVRAVMAENNGSYTNSRPVLQLLSSKTWRASLASLWSRVTAAEDLTAHVALTWQTIDSSGTSIPRVISTGCRQLDQELYDMLVTPVLERRKEQQMISDRALAVELNEHQAMECEATYDCECCYSTVAFEQITTCDAGSHFLCADCVSRTTIEAVYGQGWARSVDLDKASIRCFAPVLQECQATIPAALVRSALQQDASRPDVWAEFEKRVTTDVLLKSRATLQSCPCCPYAEVDETPAAVFRTLPGLHSYITITLRPHMPTQLVPIAAAILLPLLVILSSIPIATAWLLSLVTGLILLVTPHTVWNTTVSPLILPGIRQSLNRVYKGRRGLKFKCQSPSCQQTTCIRCLAKWQDPHICFDDQKTSLRTAIEASATAAVKRTCPRCFLSFVKSSGCNKLVCNCGYTMCYVCRGHITAKEGYAHFCQHFRPTGGHCTECDRCDLYGDEDEEVAIRRAVAEAEKKWRQDEAAKNKADANTATARDMVDVVVGHGKRPPLAQRWMDAMVDAVVVFQDDDTRGA